MEFFVQICLAGFALAGLCSAILTVRHFAYVGLWAGGVAGMFVVLGFCAAIHVLWREEDAKTSPDSAKSTPAPATTPITAADEAQRKTPINVERAWLDLAAPTFAKPLKELADGDNIIVDYAAFNTGDTRATILGDTIQAIALTPILDPSPYLDGLPVGPANPFVMFVDPQSRLAIRAVLHRKWTRHQIDGIINGRLAFYTGISVFYRDKFGQQHRRTVCSRFDRLSGRFIAIEKFTHMD